MHARAEQLIRLLALEPHPEGGYFREVFRASRRVEVAGVDGPRATVTTILFLSIAERPSRWHRLVADEVWSYVEGDPLALYVWEGRDGLCSAQRLGAAGPGAEPLAVVPAGSWQAVRSEGAYTLVSCTVAPGFEFSDFTLLADVRDEAERLRRRCPLLADLI